MVEVLGGIVAAVGVVYLLWRLFVWNTRRRMINAFRSALIALDQQLHKLERELQRMDPSEARRNVLFLEREVCAGLAHLARKISIVTRARREAADWALMAIRLEEKGIAGMHEAAPILRSLGQFETIELIVRVADRLAGLLTDFESQPEASEGFPDFDPYEQLEVSPNASSDVIQAAYRRLARKHHPDSSIDPDAARMVKINIAFKTLSSAELRRAYGMWRAAPQRTDQSGGDPTGGRQSPRSEARRRERAAPRAVGSERPSGVSPFALVVLAIVVVVGGSVVIGAIQSGQGDTAASFGGSATTRPSSAVPDRQPTVPASEPATTSVVAPAPAVAAATPPVTAVATATPPAPAVAAATPPAPAVATATPSAPAVATATPPAPAVATATPPAPAVATATPPAPAVATATPPAPAVAAATPPATLPPSSAPKPTQPSVLTSFGDGTYLVPDEVAPGVYAASNAGEFCAVYGDRPSRVAQGPGAVTVTVLPGWSTIRVSGCGTFRPHSPSVLTSFGDGTYLVPDEVAPGVYAASNAGEFCAVYGDRPSRVAQGPGAVTVTALPGWSTIRVSGCGTFRPHSPSVLTSFGDGTYLVPDEVAPGVYAASNAGEFCAVYGDRPSRVAQGPGAVTVTVLPGWSTIRVSGCGTFRPHSPSVLTSFGDGTYLVPDEVAPGVYAASNAGEFCAVYGDRPSRVAQGPGAVTVTVLPGWSTIRVSGCGTFRPHSPSVLTSFGDGTYLVPDEVAPGVYAASNAGEFCAVYGDRPSRVAQGPGAVTVTVLPGWSTIRVSSCGMFRRQ